MNDSAVIGGTDSGNVVEDETNGLTLSDSGPDHDRCGRRG
ncbi:hypothetical protein ACTG25_26660 [Aeromonas sp. 80P]